MAAKIATFYDHVLDIAEQQNISVKEALQEVHGLGIHFLEVSVDKAKEKPIALYRLLNSVGMSVCSMPAYFDFACNPDYDSQILPVLKLAKTIRAKRILVIPGFLKGTAQMRRRQADNILMGMSRLAELMGRSPIELIMEDFDAPNAPFCTSIEMVSYLHMCPRLNFCFDTGNFRFSGEDPFVAYERLRKKVTHVHLKDRLYTPDYGRRGLKAADGQTLYPCPVGSGEIPIDRIIKRLREDHYTGIYTLEHYGAKDQLACLKQSVKWLNARVD